MANSHRLLLLLVWLRLLLQRRTAGTSPTVLLRHTRLQRQWRERL